VPSDSSLPSIAAGQSGLRLVAMMEREATSSEADPDPSRNPDSAKGSSGRRQCRCGMGVYWAGVNAPRSLTISPAPVRSYGSFMDMLFKLTLSRKKDRVMTLRPRCPDPENPEKQGEVRATDRKR
jgi:hypothetical protein